MALALVSMTRRSKPIKAVSFSAMIRSALPCIESNPEIAAREGIHAEQVVAIGDGANDVAMLSQAGLGIAYHARPRVKEGADASLSGGMSGILYLLGCTEHDLSEIESQVAGGRPSHDSGEGSAP